MKFSRIELAGQEDDSDAFLCAAEAMLNGALRDYRAEAVYVVKIDNWFGPKWRRFSGKVHGAVGRWEAKLTLPPFVPERVIHETHYEPLEDNSYRMRRPQWSVHFDQSSQQNLTRGPDGYHRGAAFFWFSGNSKSNGRGCLMAYLPTGGSHRTWYAEILARDAASLGITRGISRKELAHFAEIGGVQEPDREPALVGA